jgi:thioredoxin reductase (NADPH)
LSEKFDVIVVGSGMAGLMCATELKRMGLHVALLEEQIFGGLVININHLTPSLEDADNGGADLASTWVSDLSAQGLDIIYDGAMGLDLTDGIALQTSTDSLRAKALVIATGARLKRLGLEREEDLSGKGVSQCADCDGPMYQKEEVVIVGGGDSAAQEASVLAQFCSRVHWVHRGSELKARVDLVETALAHDHVELYLQTEVVSLLGEDTLSGVELKNSSLQTRVLPCRGFFAYVGLAPNVEWLSGQLRINSHGGIMVSENLETSYPGVFAIGAVRDGFGGLLKHAQADATHVAIEIVRHLAEDD